MLKLGIYEQLINQEVQQSLIELENNWSIEKDQLDTAESSIVLGQYLGKLIGTVLGYFEKNDEVLNDRIALCNATIQFILNYMENEAGSLKKSSELYQRIQNYLIDADGELLLEIYDRNANRVNRPETSISMSSLFTGDSASPNMISELRKEIESADRIDFLISFIKFSGLRLLLDELKTFVNRGGQLRVITTCYMGATDYKAVEVLSKLPNTEIKISYDTKRTRLHAKSYVFWRETGFNTLYIGSSNMSESAMTSGLEWNVKLTQQDSPEILKKVEVTFDHYWHSSEFETFVLNVHGVELRKALKSERAHEPTSLTHLFVIQPYYYQQEILDQLQVERDVHNNYRNLVVAATGTGKTIIAAFDYKRYRQANPGKPSRLLFVAHRQEILEQSQAAFQTILRDLNFGSLMVGGHEPESFDHLFVSIQSLNSKTLLERTASGFYDYIVIDEFHHAAAPSYQALLAYYKPTILLGLTATPERADNKDILQYFGGRASAEIRLYEAIERKLLSPFHYFGVTDSVDLRNVRWVMGKYDERELENVFVLDEQLAMLRIRNIYDAIDRYCPDTNEIIGIGFCVSKSHAAFMAEKFNLLGIPSDYLTSDSDTMMRETVKNRLVSREINFIFVVDLYNEGVDIPEVNTVLFLRPTESLTVYLQQLGRGLRLSEGKEALTVLDFVGHARAEYNFEARFQALLPKNRRSVLKELEHQFPNVPRGCSIQLEKKAQDIILGHIKSSIINIRTIRTRVKDFYRSHEDTSIGAFFDNYHIAPKDVYKTKNSVLTLAVEERVSTYEELDEARKTILTRGLLRLTAMNSVRLLKTGMTLFPRLKDSDKELFLGSTDSKLLVMLYYTYWTNKLTDFETIEAAFHWLFQHDICFDETMGMLRYQFEKINVSGKLLTDISVDCPIDLHCDYTKDQILAAFGEINEHRYYKHREGVLWMKEDQLDIFFITLNKSTKDFSATTMYHDYAINDQLFHWQSQNQTTVLSPTGQRYINHQKRGSRVLLFVRNYNSQDSITSPFTCLGLADYKNHHGNAPISFEWIMRERMPAFVLKDAVKM